MEKWLRRLTVLCGEISEIDGEDDFTPEGMHAGLVALFQTDEYGYAHATLEALQRAQAEAARWLDDGSGCDSEEHY